MRRDITRGGRGSGATWHWCWVGSKDAGDHLGERGK